MSTIEITGIRIRRALVPMRRPLATRVGSFTHGPFLLIDLECRGGIAGRVPAFTFMRLGLKIVPEAIAFLVDGLKGRPIGRADLPGIYDECMKRIVLLGTEGVMQTALSMLDMALHDAVARAEGIPLYRLLGGKPDPIPAYNSCDLGLMEPQAAAREARELAAERGGFRHIKMRLGRTRIEDDVAAIRAVRAAVGPELLVSCDFNQGLASHHAFEACRAIDDLGLYWIEEPVAYDDFPTQAALTRKLATPIQVGETWWSWRVGTQAIETGACDWIMPDILRIGGVTGWMRLARAAEARAVPFSSHLSPNFSAHCLAATATCHWLEYMDWAEDLILDPVVPDTGFARPGGAAGAGVEWNEAAVAKVLVDA